MKVKKTRCKKCKNLLSGDVCLCFGKRRNLQSKGNKKSEKEDEKLKGFL